MTTATVAASLLSIDIHPELPTNSTLAKTRYAVHVRTEANAVALRLSPHRPSDADSFDTYNESASDRQVIRRLVRRTTLSTGSEKTISWYSLTGNGAIVLESATGAITHIDLGDIDVQALKLLLHVLVTIG